jgi:hypothetical protein
MRSIYIILFIILASCSHDSNLVNNNFKAPQGWSSLNTQKAFICFPAEWHVNQDVEGTLFAVMSPLENETDNFRENATLVPSKKEQPESLTIEQFAAANAKDLQTYLQGYELIKQDTTAISGHKAYKFIYDYDSGERRLRTMSILVLVNHWGYVFACTGVSKEFDNYMDQFNEIANTLQIKE